MTRHLWPFLSYYSFEIDVVLYDLLYGYVYLISIFKKPGYDRHCSVTEENQPKVSWNHYEILKNYIVDNNLSGRLSRSWT